MRRQRYSSAEIFVSFNLQTFRSKHLNDGIPSALVVGDIGKDILKIALSKYCKVRKARGAL